MDLFYKKSGKHGTGGREEGCTQTFSELDGVVRLAGVEPATASSEDSCSIQLSYRRVTQF